MNLLDARSSNLFEQVWAPKYAATATNIRGQAREGGSQLLKKASVSVVPTIDEKERVFNALLQGPNGLKRIAFAMQVPLKDRLDYVAVGRKLLLIDELPQGEVPQYDLDIPEFGAVKIAARGAAPIVEANIKRVEFPTFPISVNTEVAWEEIQIRRYPAFDRAKERAAIANAIAEDLEIFRLITRAAQVGPNPITGGAAPFARNVWVDMFATLTSNQLAPGAYLMHPRRFADILKFSSTEIDQVSLNVIVETGQFGVLHGTRLIVSTKLSDQSLWLVTTPDKLGRIPERKAVEIKVWDNVPQQRYDIVSWEQIGMGIHNTGGVVQYNRTGGSL